MHGTVILGGHASVEPVNSSFRGNPCLITRLYSLKYKVTCVVHVSRAWISHYIYHMGKRGCVSDWTVLGEIWVWRIGGGFESLEKGEGKGLLIRPASISLASFLSILPGLMKNFEKKVHGLLPQNEDQTQVWNPQWGIVFSLIITIQQLR